MNNYQNLWNNILIKLKEDLGEKVFNEVFADSQEVFTFEKGYVFVVVPNPLIKFRIQSFFMQKINDIAKDVYPEKIGFKFLSQAEANDKKKEMESKDLDVPVIETRKVTRNLSSLYTFSSFVVGESNRYAYLTATKVADNCGTFCNPLYIFGEVGLGKTHLMNAIGNFVLDNDINANVVYVSSQKFTEDYFLATASKNSDKIQSFYDKYNNADLLLIDDIQFLEGKTATQEEFFKIFEHLVSNNKQIVLTSDRPASSLKNVMARLKSRFSMGICVDIKQPDQSLLIDVLKNKLSYMIEDPNSVPNDILLTIASYYPNNIRDLEGSLRTYVNYCTCMNKSFDESSLFEALEKIIPKMSENTDSSKIVFENVLNKVCSYYKISQEDIISASRKQNIAYARQILIYILKTDFNLSIKFIGDNLGNRDHSTIIHSIDKIVDDMKNNYMVKNDYEFLLKQLDK